MKNRIIKFMAAIVVAALAIVNVSVLSHSQTKDITLDRLVGLNSAHAEDDTWGDYYIEWYTPYDVACYSGGYFCCPGWGDCTI